ncbi:MAG: hypothetical protein ACYC2H_13630, partial [Thermoplasmatota archaeon]
MTAAEAASQPTTATPAAPAADAGEAAPAKEQYVDIRNLQDKFNSLLEQRNNFNDLARKAADERNQLNEQRRSKAAGIEASKVARDAANE